MTQRGKPAEVLLSVNAYERSQQEREILKLLALGEREIAAGGDTILTTFSLMLMRFSRKRESKVYTQWKVPVSRSIAEIPAETFAITALLSNYQIPKLAY